MKFIFKLNGILSTALFLLAVGNPLLLLGQCSQNNFTVSGFELRDESGNPFSVTDDYELGDLVNGELWIMLGGSSTNGYNLSFYFDVYVDGVLAQADQYECLFSGIQAVQGVWIKVRDFSWNWGDVIDIKNIFIHWETGTAKSNSTCTISDKNNINSQCYGNPQGFTAAVPLFPKFDFEGNGVCNTTIQFSSQTIGGTPPYNYAYSWDFDNDGIIDSMQENPLFDFPSSGTFPISLTVNDGTSITTIVKEIFIDPNFDIQVTIFPTKKDEESGIIYVESVTGGTEPYTFYWTGPNGFTSTSEDIFNLSDGFYTLIVTDANGCTQTVTYELEIAQILGSFWRSIHLSGDRSEIKIRWEVTSKEENSYFEIERSSGDVSNFTCIGTVEGKYSGGETEVYLFSDKSIPVLDNTFYYRIKRKSDTVVDYSSVKMFTKEVYEFEKQWIVYPNPSLGQDVFLKYLGIIGSNQGPLTIDYFSSAAYFQSLTFQNLPSESINLKEVFQSLPEGHLTLRIQLGHKVEIIHLIH
ncbi:PKD domain-containing protein [Algoriphagus sp. D3-2-R+10]|uniref:PKD domain-containing protein n=1 Tax=Algoriphagus aurantiacus TaxID=3103948 RepID=UPI002B37376B|nr:PKD domain-containing protein [Algoriphagus sp. D3-2-R+10]MEB2778439.1 PKD domain-containing protein [Algoriphagus sp. D3-2-R+10]